MQVHFPDNLRLRVPRGLPGAVQRAAAQRHTTPSEWARQTLRAAWKPMACISGTNGATRSSRTVANEMWGRGIHWLQCASPRPWASRYVRSTGKPEACR
jgi:hypothetical protein